MWTGIENLRTSLSAILQHHSAAATRIAELEDEVCASFNSCAAAHSLADHNSSGDGFLVDILVWCCLTTVAQHLVSNDVTPFVDRS